MSFHWEHIQTLAKAHHMEDPTASVPSFERFLRWWWCQKYNRPMKDPLLNQYTLDELCYEFLRHYYSTPSNDPKKELEAKSVKEDEDAWIKAQMAQIAPAPKPKESPAAQALPIQDSQPPAELPEISTKFDT